MRTAVKLLIFFIVLSFSACEADSNPGGDGEVILPNTMSSGMYVVEFFYDVESSVSSSDTTYEWVVLYNNTANHIDLSSYSIGYGGDDYTYGTYQLSGTIAPGETFVAGGPNQVPQNGSPTYDLTQDFNPDMQNSGTMADGIALFDVVATSITTATVPIDACIYGGTNTNNLMDASGSVGSVDIGDVPEGSSIRRRGDGMWKSMTIPVPNSVWP